MTDLPQNQSELRDWLRHPEATQTFVQTSAQAIQTRTGRFGAFARNDNTPFDDVMDAFLEARGDEINIELTPLVGVDPNDHTKIVLEAGDVKNYMVRQTAPSIVNLGMVSKKEEILEHKDLVNAMLDTMKDENGKRMKVDALLISERTGTMVAQFPLEITDMSGEIVKHNLVVYSNIKRSAGSGVVLWSMPIACTNQIPVMQQSGGANGYTISSNKNSVRLEKLLGTASDFARNANKRMVDIYAKLSNHQLNDEKMSNLLNVLYPNPEYKLPKMTDTGLDSTKRIEQWSQSKKEAEKNREMVLWLIENANGTHSTPARRQMNLYNYLQAVSELETKRPYGDVVAVTKQFLAGGTRQKKVAFAFGQCLETLRRNKVSY